MDGYLNPESADFESRPRYYIGQHDSHRPNAVTDEQYNHFLNSGFQFVTTPITNQHFYDRVVELYKTHLKEREAWGLSDAHKTNQSLPGPVVPTLTNKDTSYAPSNYVGSLVAYASPWIDLCSEDPLISSISRQVLNLELAYATFCGARSVIIPGPRQDESGRAVMLYARAIQEALDVASRINIIIHMPMFREPGLEEVDLTLSEVFGPTKDKTASGPQEIDLFSAWDSWNSVRSVCKYNNRLFVALRIPLRAPEKDLQERWFSEPLHYLTLSSKVFQLNKAGHPSLSRNQQDLINRYMRLKNSPWLLLSDVGSDDADITTRKSEENIVDFPTLSEAAKVPKRNQFPPLHPYVGYLRHLEKKQPPFTAMEAPALVSFQDWLQSPLQPLADNLESATYEVFEGDPVKYNQYELAIAEAMKEWKTLGKPVSSANNTDLVVAVAGAGRGPLVTRVLRAAASTGTAIQLWALEKNQNAYVYLLRQNELQWNGQVTVVKTDMRGWPGPDPSRSGGAKVDILVTELLGSFGDNELSPECLDGIQRHVARPHGVSIPESYTAHLSPIATPRIHADLSGKVLLDKNAFETPWVTRLFQLDFVAAEKVPGHPRFQQAWEFVHPVEVSEADRFLAEHGAAARYATQGTGSMAGSSGMNDHNARHCHLTFVCRTRGVVHGLAGYFESVLYRPREAGRDKVEISILPDQIDRKSRDMISWFPIFFPIKQPLYFPQDAELEVSMWRQTDDTKVWYEWIIEAYAWAGPKTRIKVGASEMHSSREVGCRM